MRFFFIARDLSKIVEEGYDDSPVVSDDSSSTSSSTETSSQVSTQNKEKIKNNALALSYLHQGISKTIYPRIFGISKAKDAWETLKKEFQGNSKVVSIRLQSLWKNFDCLTMKESESIKDFFSRVTEIVNQIRAYGEHIEEKKIVEKILRSLPPKFDHAAAGIEESKDLSILTMYDLCGSLESHEERMKRSSGQSLEQALQLKVNLGRKIQQRRGNFQHQDQFQRSQNNLP